MNNYYILNAEERAELLEYYEGRVKGPYATIAIILVSLVGLAFIVSQFMGFSNFFFDTPHFSVEMKGFPSFFSIIFGAFSVASWAGFAFLLFSYTDFYKYWKLKRGKIKARTAFVKEKRVDSEAPDYFICEGISSHIEALNADNFRQVSEGDEIIIVYFGRRTIGIARKRERNDESG